jgi:hypothetical protein
MADDFAIGRIEKVSEEAMVYTVLDWAAVFDKIKIVAYWPY